MLQYYSIIFLATDRFKKKKMEKTKILFFYILYDYNYLNLH